MLGTIGQLLPVGLAAALSTVPVAVLLVIMLSSRRRAATVPYVIGCVLGTLVVVGLASLAAQLFPPSRPRETQWYVAVLEIVLGAVLVGLGVRSWWRRGRSAQRPLLPARVTSLLDTVRAGQALVLGMLIELRPKSVLLACVVALQVRAAPRDVEAVAVLAIYTAIATSTLTVPALWAMLAAERAEPRLRRLAEVLDADGVLISAVVLVMVGVVVVGAGLQGLG
ncbi:MAG TPA: GAP family protein [Microlunatus sp.]|nr:GAP family protein [Microlunatus sp.]